METVMDEPVYRQIAKDLREQITTGRIAPGSQYRTSRVAATKQVTR
jgi:DNA-binding transcriptional regulator YhcF (GntR family)